MKSKSLSFWERLASVRLTLVCMALMMCLIFFGTLAQVNIGTFAAQKEYFNQFFIYTHRFGFRLPIFPGGLTVGGLWFINLSAAFFFKFRFRFVRKDTGIL